MLKGNIKKIEEQNKQLREQGNLTIMQNIEEIMVQYGYKGEVFK